MKKYILLVFLFGFFLNTYSQWDIVCNPLPNHGLHDIRFLNNDTGFVVGEKFVSSGLNIGVIGKTINGGFDWQFIEYPNIPLLAINFLNNDTGFVGGFQQILKTIDGGNSWLSVDLTLSGIYITGYFYSFWFLTNQHGYAASWFGLLETFDCGESWVYVHTSSGLDVDGFNIMFSSDSIGYVGSAFKTTDGGNNWDTIPNILDLPHLQCNNYSNSADEAFYNYYNDSLGFIIGHETLGNAGIYKTDDGGINWDFTSIPYMGTLNAIEFIDEYIIHAAGNTGFVLELPLPDPFFSFIKTVDGGNNWYYQQSNLDTVGFIISSLEFTNDKTGYATANYWNINHDPVSVILKTTNGGGPMFSIPGQSYSITENVIDMLKVYPNPFSEQLEVMLNNSLEISTIHIMDVNGRVVYFESPFNNKVKLNLSFLTCGIYFIKVTNSDSIYFKKIIKH